ncbi:MAG TPA: MFS transporter [Burkholderiales bacterium]|nr:MFS transporter [Burkholderiales bacterium]
MSAPRAAAAIAAATALNLPFGTLYAFSVFLKPMEALIGVGRAQMSFVFALATITLTLGMVLAPSIYRRLPPPLIALSCGACSAVGLFIAATARSFAELIAGYGVLFGIGAGIGFILVQQGVNQSVSARSGLANGYVVSLYPLGAMLGAPLFGWAIEAYGIRATLAGLGVAVFAGCALTALLLRAARIRMHQETAEKVTQNEQQWRVFLLLATVFFLAAAAGLMVMSQAAGIVQAYGGATALAVGATTFITGAVGAARIAGGWLVDRFSIPRVAMGSQLFALCGALIFSLFPGPRVAVPALAMIGMGYGVISGLTAAAIARYWGKNAFGRVAGRLYVAWCVAAISLPILAGWLYDRTGGYGVAVLIAGGLNLLAVGVAVRLPKP